MLLSILVFLVFPSCQVLPGLDVGDAVKEGVEVVPGVLRPQDYGVNCWESLDQRIRRNLATQLVDRARMEVASGDPASALKTTEEAVDTILHFEGASCAFVSRPHLSPPAVDARGLAERARTQLELGCLQAPLYAWWSLDPGRTRSIEAVRLPSDPPYEGAWQLLLARAARSSGEPDKARERASVAVVRFQEDLGRIWSRTVENPRSPEIAMDWNFLAGTPGSTRSPWGYTPVPYVVDHLTALLDEASGIAGIARVKTPEEDGLAARIAAGRAQVGTPPFWFDPQQVEQAPT